jgi:hypothetical protein
MSDNFELILKEKKAQAFLDLQKQLEGLCTFINKCILDWYLENKRHPIIDEFRLDIVYREHRMPSADELMKIVLEATFAKCKEIGVGISK